MQPSSRRQFIGKSAKAGIATIIATPAIGALLSATGGIDKTAASSSSTGFEQTPLSYDYAALEPYIDATTMNIHYNKHAAAYSKNLKEAALAEKVDLAKPIEDLLHNISKYSAKMRNNGGGHYNHELFWKCLSPKGSSTKPGVGLQKAIVDNFGSMEEMIKKFSDAAKTRFGSGWAWLLINSNKKLIICSTPNQDNPLMDVAVAETKGTPLLALDVWEHAYYLKYQNKRADYIDSFWKVVNWDFVSSQFDAI